ncbi:hypothetical protein ACWGR4_30255 [Embleya sp. NPDC055664]
MPTYRRGSSLGRDRHTSGVARGSEWDLFVNRLRSAPVAMASIPEHLPALRAAVAMIRIPATSEPSPLYGDDLTASSSTRAAWRR